jgi:hypothetical protein
MDEMGVNQEPRYWVQWYTHIIPALERLRQEYQDTPKQKEPAGQRI